MKKATWDSPNKMHFESDFATFNKQTNLITTGNAYCNTQMSSYIRAWSNVKNGAYIGKCGDFLEYDLRSFGYIPPHIEKLLRDKNRTESYILYEFFVWSGKKREVIGYVLTDSLHNFIADSIVCECGCSWQKRRSAIDACKEYICA